MDKARHRRHPLDTRDVCFRRGRFALLACRVHLHERGSDESINPSGVWSVDANRPRESAGRTGPVGYGLRRCRENGRGENGHPDRGANSLPHARSEFAHAYDPGRSHRRHVSSIRPSRRRNERLGGERHDGNGSGDRGESGYRRGTGAQQHAPLSRRLHVATDGLMWSTPRPPRQTSGAPSGWTGSFASSKQPSTESTAGEQRGGP